MTYAAEIDEANVVLRVLVVPSIAWCEENIGGTWLETFADGSQRGKLAGPGDTYDEALDAFVSPPAQHEDEPEG